MFLPHFPTSFFLFIKFTPKIFIFKGGKQWSKSWKDEECFGSPLDLRVKGEFDFEKNLALFDKQALWEELNTQRTDVARNVENRKKYR